MAADDSGFLESLVPEGLYWLLDTVVAVKRHDSKSAAAQLRLA